MAKVITFSEKFPPYHPRAGEPTYFPQMICQGVYPYIPIIAINADPFLTAMISSPKYHTIRVGNRFKEGDYFSPRVWSDKPYKSKQQSFCDDIEVKKVFDISILETYEVFINGSFYGSFGSENLNILAQNDGLSHNDFRDWFIKKLPFKGQIICWSDKVNY